MRFEIQDNIVAVLRAALELRARRRLSFWDSAIIAAAQAMGCVELYSEDLGHEARVNGLVILNPFR